MVIGIFGESCTGKSTLASRLKASCKDFQILLLYNVYCQEACVISVNWQ